MKKFVLAAAALLSLATVASAAQLKLTDQQLDQTVAGNVVIIYNNASNNGNNNGNGNSGNGNGNYNGNLNGAYIIINIHR